MDSVTEELRRDVRDSLPEIDDIQDPTIRQGVVEAWALALSETEFESIKDIRAAGGPDTPPLKGDGTQADHLSGVARIAVAIMEVLENQFGPIGANRDVLIASALCHDVGKPFEFSEENRKRWSNDPSNEGFPPFRHPTYGAHLCLSVGLPLSVAHAVGAHSKEGQFLARSVEATIVYFADRCFWRILSRAGMLAGDHPWD